MPLNNFKLQETLSDKGSQKGEKDLIEKSGEESKNNPVNNSTVIDESVSMGLVGDQFSPKVIIK